MQKRPQEELTVQQYAEVLAQVIYFGTPRKAESLARLGIAERTWAASDAKWMAALMDEALEDDHPVATTFAAAFGPVFKRLKKEKPALESLGPLPGAASASDARPVAPQPLAALVPPVLPPLANQPEARWARWAGAQRLDDVEPAPPARPMAPSMPAVQRVPPALAATSLSVAAPKAPALPFVPGEAQAAPASGAGARLPPVQRAPAALTGTSLSVGGPQGPPLPFEPGEAASGAGVRLPPVQRAPAALTGTSLSVGGPQGPPLPFEPGPARPENPLPSTSPPSAVSKDAQAPPRKAPSPLAETMDPEMGALVAALARGALPFAAGSAPAARSPTTGVLPVVPELPQDDLGPNSLDRYAAVCGALARGLPREQALARHGSSPDDFSRLIRFWMPRFELDPALHATFKEMAKTHARSGQDKE